MTTLEINKAINLKTVDNKDMMYISGVIVQSNFEMGVQPKTIAYIDEVTNIVIDKDGKYINLKKESSPTYNLEVKNKDPWMLYGSDHNSGVLWFGDSQKINNLYQDIEKVYIEHVKKNKFTTLKDEKNGLDITGSPIVRWDFDDGNSLVIAYVDIDYQKFSDITEIKDKNVISYVFGAVADDKLLNEFLQPYIAKILKKIKIPGLEVDMEDLGDEEDFPIEVNGNQITSKNNELLLKLAEHIYCSIMKWHEEDSASKNQIKEDEEENGFDFSNMDKINESLAKKIMKNKLIKSLDKPMEATKIRLVYSEEDSNKEYNIEFKKDNGNWIINTVYGGVGKKMTEKSLLSTVNMEEAQDVYMGLLKEKLAKGYELDKGMSMKNKVNI